mmetsp:Transcript_75502/g.179334  ORF Transcript_75502/g.179334 Transcript_75502/m.179334 type:complete len:168 (+) Transcript_75502:63-566(+)
MAKTALGKKEVKSTTPQSTPKLKKKIEPGSILILVAGRFRGKRVVFLRQLPSGLLLVTGPFKVNGVPLRRVNQCYCIGTSTKVDLGGADFSKIDDAYFAKEKKKKEKKSESAFFATEAEAPKLTQEKKDEQAKMEAPLVKAITGDMKSYLKARFALSNRDYPHEMMF